MILSNWATIYANMNSKQKHEFKINSINDIIKQAKSAQALAQEKAELIEWGNSKANTISKTFKKYSKK